MPEMMKCFVMHGLGKVGVMDKPVPRPGPSDAIIRTTAALICTSDIHTVAGAIGDRQRLTLGHQRPESISVSLVVASACSIPSRKASSFVDGRAHSPLPRCFIAKEYARSPAAGN